MDDLCRRYQESYGDPHMPEELIQHGKSCESCQEFQRKQESLEQALDEWKAPEFSEDFTLTVMARIAEAPERKRSLKEIFFELIQMRFSIPLPVGALASILFIASLLLNLFLWGKPTPVTVPPSHMNIASNGMEAAIVPQPNSIPTSYGNVILPREWLGSGAFLLVPIVDPHLPSNGNNETNEREDSENGRI